MKIVLDVETTGLNIQQDEILQLSIIDTDGKVLFNEYMMPEHVRSWDEAAAVHGITYDFLMEKNAKTFSYYKELIQKIINAADVIVGYNIFFDISFLENQGIVFDEKTGYYDVMKVFAKIYGERSEKHGHYKWQPLSVCARYYGYQFHAHDALEDIKATLHCYRCIQKQEEK